MAGRKSLVVCFPHHVSKLVLVLVVCFHFPKSEAQCNQAQADQCNALARCDPVSGCVCDLGMYGDGTECSTEAATIRVSFQLTGEQGRNAATRQKLLALASDLFADPSALPPNHESSFTYSLRSDIISMAIIYKDLNATADAMPALKPELLNGQLSYENTTIFYDGTVPIHFDSSGGVYRDGRLSVEPRQYLWTVGTNDDPVEVQASGMTVDRVYFNPVCKNNGCWVIDVLYTTGGDDAFNVFFLPRSDNDDALSFDFDYTGTELDASFLPRNFPCGDSAYNQQDAMAGGEIPAAVSACCIPDFIDRYRPVSSFELDTFGENDPDLSALRAVCVDPRNPPRVSVDNMPASHLQGQFSDTDASGARLFQLNVSEVRDTGVIDPYQGVYSAQFVLDEVELRRYLSRVSGVVGVEWQIDTFVGLANFKPLGLPFLDMGFAQVEVHLERTNYFTVATHGTNDYSFLDYVNLRLVEVLVAGGGSPAVAQYVQVTFTLAAKYAVTGAPFDLVPLDSVRVGKGIFPSDTTFRHACLDYGGSAVHNTLFPDLLTRGAFDSQLAQACGPEADMCQNPSVLSDGFVAFNVPVGFDWLPPASSDLSSQVFVHMVVQTENTEALAGGSEESPAASEITKTTLSASVGVVEGGTHVFCDGLVARTDLREVANAVIVVGSAASEAEFAQLRVLGEAQSITDRALSRGDAARIDSVSIEGGLLTLILQGNQSFFAPAANEARGDFGLELEDVVTIHIMEAAEGFEADGSAAKLVFDLLAAAPAPEFDVGEARGAGFLLNGAFFLEVLSDQNRARLQPSGALLNSCGWRATRPSLLAGPIPTTCVIRRDVMGRNFYPADGSAPPTAMELPHCDPAAAACGATLPATSAAAGSGGEADDVEEFMERVLGASPFARGLGQGYAALLARRFNLNNFDNRGYWINPGYEWAPSLTGERSTFTLSQKIFMFALVALNENRAADRYVVGGSQGGRRRVLLQATAAGGSGEEEEGPESRAAAALEFGVSAEQLMADTLGVPRAQIGAFEVRVKLTLAQACMADIQLMGQLRNVLHPILMRTTSSFLERGVQIMQLVVDGGIDLCEGARRGGAGGRGLLQITVGGEVVAAEEAYTSAVATVETLVAFEDGEPVMNVKEFLDSPGIVGLRHLRGLEPEDDPSFGREAEEGESGGGGGGWEIEHPGLVAGGIGIGVCVLMVVCGTVYVRRKNKEVLEIEKARLEELEAGKPHRSGVGEEVAEGERGGASGGRDIIRSAQAFDGKKSAGADGKPAQVRNLDDLKSQLHGQLAIHNDD